MIFFPFEILNPPSLTTFYRWENELLRGDEHQNALGKMAHQRKSLHFWKSNWSCQDHFLHYHSPACLVFERENLKISKICTPPKMLILPWNCFVKPLVFERENLKISKICTPPKLVTLRWNCLIKLSWKHVQPKKKQVFTCTPEQYDIVRNSNIVYRALKKLSSSQTGASKTETVWQKESLPHDVAVSPN